MHGERIIFRNQKGEGMSDWLPIESVSGGSLGWIKPELVVSVSPGSGQRLIEYRDGDRIRMAQRKYGFDDDEFMRRLGLPSPTSHRGKSCGR